MDNHGGYAPAVRSILEAARAREGGTEPLSVEARPFHEALERAEADGRVPIIAEIKPTSPTSEGVHEGDPVELATAMVDGGAVALSVLTEPTHFGGSPAALAAIRDAVDVPVLRKDFVLREDHLDVVAADLILLIARFVDDLERLVEAARARGMQPLVEVHTRAELTAAVDAGATLIGINNRDLASLTVDLDTFETVSDAAPTEVLLVAESGLSTPDDIRQMRRAGADALLIGTAIMDGDVTANTRRFTRA